MELLTPRAVFSRAAALCGVAFLDGRAGLTRARYSHLAWAPLRQLRIESGGRTRIHGATASEESVLDAIDRFLAEESAAGRTVIGALGYELCRWLEPRAAAGSSGDLPVALLGGYERTYTFDHEGNRWLAPPPELPVVRTREVHVSSPRPNLDRDAYQALFGRVQQWIAAGDIYQANLSIRFDADIDGSAAAFYEKLAECSPMPYGAYLDWGDVQILSNSPELFLERRGDRITTRPIKGTRPRGLSPAEDRRLTVELRIDDKECAEHVMIVDLERNDLGRIAEIGSVRVQELQSVESYSTLHHMESTISARLRSGVRFSEILRAAFPGGSITGAPKIRAMQILAELEPQGRGFYTGAILHYPPGGDFTMNIAIRTATVRGGRIRYAAGGGVVADSLAEREYEECLLKAQAFFTAVTRS